MYKESLDVFLSFLDFLGIYWAVNYITFFKKYFIILSALSFRVLCNVRLTY